MLEQQGIHATCCEQLDELTEHLRERRFDVLLTDVQMPAINGFDLLKLLRASNIPQAKTIPVIAVTARSDMDAAEFIEHGFSGCLHKPFTVAELLIQLKAPKQLKGESGKFTSCFLKLSAFNFQFSTHNAMLVKIYPENPNLREIDKVVNIMRDGGLVIYPTDTVYAIGCDALNVRAVEKICQLKGVNPQKSNLSIICYDLSNLSEYAKVSNAAFKLMKKNLPGAFTFILPTSSELPKIYKNRKEVGIRVPDNNIIRTLVRELGNPILTMSLHDKDEIIEYSTDPELIEEKYENLVDIVIDGGYGGTEASTVINCTTDDFEIIRQGKGELIY